jgi:hypothetical protein
VTDRAFDALKAAAVIAVLAIGGYLLFHELGTERALTILGFEVTTASTAPDSQCDRAREQESTTDDILCIPDRDWLRRYLKACAQGKADGLVYVDDTGTLTDAGTCTGEARRVAAAARSRPIPAGYRLGDDLGAPQAEGAPPQRG